MNYRETTETLQLMGFNVHQVAYPAVFLFEKKNTIFFRRHEPKPTWCDRCVGLVLLCSFTMGLLTEAKVE